MKLSMRAKAILRDIGFVIDRLLSLGAVCVFGVVAYKSFEFWAATPGDSGVVSGTGWAFVAGITCITAGLRSLMDLLEPRKKSK